MSVTPLWWTRARELRAKGLSLSEVGRLCGKHHTSVLHATSEEVRREKYRAQRRGQWKPRQRLPKSPEQKIRNLIVNRAHAEARETGQHVDAVLIGWKTYPRRGMQA